MKARIAIRRSTSRRMGHTTCRVASSSNTRCATTALQRNTTRCADAATRRTSRSATVRIGTWGSKTRTTDRRGRSLPSKRRSELFENRAEDGIVAAREKHGQRDLDDRTLAEPMRIRQTPKTFGDLVADVQRQLASLADRPCARMELRLRRIEGECFPAGLGLCRFLFGTAFLLHDVPFSPFVGLVRHARCVPYGCFSPEARKTGRSLLRGTVANVSKLGGGVVRFRRCASISARLSRSLFRRRAKARIR